MNIKYKFGIFSILLFFLAFVHFGARAQEKAKKTEGNGSPYISWVGELPVVKQVKHQNKFLTDLYKLLFGKSKKLSLVRPVGVWANSSKEIFVLDQGNQTVIEIKEKKLNIPHALKRKEDYFTSLVGMCRKPNGDLLFTDSRLNKIFMVSSNGKRFEVFSDTLKLEQPTGIAYNQFTNETWVVETGAHKISILDSAGKRIKTIGTRGKGQGEFNFPTSLWIDQKGDVYIVDAMNFRIEIFDKDGKFIATFGELGDGSGYLARPKGIATDAFGNIYIVDAQFHVVQIFDRNGQFLYRFGGQGSKQGEFWLPAGIYIDENNLIYVADSYNSRIQIFQLINNK